MGKLSGNGVHIGTAGRFKLLVVVPTMEMGGAERCVAEILRYLDRRRFAAELIMVFERKAFYEIPPDIPVHVLEREPMGEMQASGSDVPVEMLRFGGDYVWLQAMALRLAGLVRRSRPKVVLARHIFSSVLCCLSRKFWPADTCLVVSSDTYTSRVLLNHRHGALYSEVIRRHFGTAERVVALSQGAADDLAECYGVPANRVTVIPNPVDVDEIRRLARYEVRHTWYDEGMPIVISVGRLVETKGFGDLLHAMRLVGHKGLRTRGVIVGDGEDRERLERLAEELGLGRDIWFAGMETNPFKYVARSSAFVLASRYEGFANVIGEAMACGCPVISTDCPSGPAEILQGGRCGILVPVGDCEALADAIIRVITDEEYRAELIRRGLERAQEFNSKRVVGIYENLIMSIAEK